MKFPPITATIVCLLAATAVPGMAEETSSNRNKGEVIPPDKFIHKARGDWHIQQFLGEPIPPRGNMMLTLKANDRYRLRGNVLEQDMASTYQIGKNDNVLVLQPPKGQSEEKPIGFDEAMMIGKALLLAHEDGPTVMTRESKDRPDAAAVGRASGIVQGFLDYKDIKGGKFAPDIGTLVAEGYIPVEMALSPRVPGLSAPDDFEQWSQKRQRRWVNRNASYIAIGTGSLSSQQARLVELPPRPNYHGTISVAFGDGHVEMMSYKQANELVRKQTGHSISHWRQSRRDKNA